MATLALLGALGAGIGAMFLPHLRRALLAGLFLLAPVDVSKAVVAPLVSRYGAIGPFYSPGLYVSPAHVVLLLLLVVDSRSTPPQAIRRSLAQVGGTGLPASTSVVLNHAPGRTLACMDGY